MKPAAFVYHAPKELTEALACLAELAPLEARVLAGGQSLVPSMAFRLVRPAHLIDINRVAGLDRLVAANNELVIGARVRHAAFERPVIEGPLGALLTRVVSSIAHYPIRMRGTFCGSLAHADPAAEWCLLAVTLDARMVVRSVRGERILSAQEFFLGVMSTALAADELLIEARLPLPSSDTRFGFEEFSRRPGDFALAMAMAGYRLIDGRMESPRIGVGGVETYPRRIPQAEALLAGQSPTIDVFSAAAEAAAAAVDPLDLPQAPVEYRRDLVATVTRRALERTLKLT